MRPGDEVTPVDGIAVGQPGRVLEVHPDAALVELELFGRTTKMRIPCERLVPGTPLNLASTRLGERLRRRELDELFAWWIEQEASLGSEPADEETLRRLDAACREWLESQRSLRRERRERLQGALAALVEQDPAEALARLEAAEGESLRRLEHDPALRKRAGELMARASHRL